MFKQLYFGLLKRLHHTLIFPGIIPMKHLLFLSLGLCSDISELKKSQTNA